MKKMFFVLVILSTSFLRGAQERAQELAQRFQNNINKITQFARARHQLPLAVNSLASYEDVKRIILPTYNKLAQTIQNSQTFGLLGPKLNKNIETQQDLKEFQTAAQTVLMTLLRQMNSQAAGNEESATIGISVSAKPLEDSAKIQKEEGKEL